jgi:hypothetical protein
VNACVKIIVLEIFENKEVRKIIRYKGDVLAGKEGKLWRYVRVEHVASMREINAIRKCNERDHLKGQDVNRKVILK